MHVHLSAPHRHRHMNVDVTIEPMLQKRKTSLSIIPLPFVRSFASLTTSNQPYTQRYNSHNPSLPIPFLPLRSPTPHITPPNQTSTILPRTKITPPTYPPTNTTSLTRRKPRYQNQQRNMNPIPRHQSLPRANDPQRGITEYVH